MPTYPISMPDDGFGRKFWRAPCSEYCLAFAFRMSGAMVRLYYIVLRWFSAVALGGGFAILAAAGRGRRRLPLRAICSGMSYDYLPG